MSWDHDASGTRHHSCHFPAIVADTLAAARRLRGDGLSHLPVPRDPALGLAPTDQRRAGLAGVRHRHGFRGPLDPQQSQPRVMQRHQKCRPDASQYEEQTAATIQP